MISRRAFLSRMAVTLGAIALAPSVVEALTPSPAVEPFVNLLDCTASSSLRGLTADIYPVWDARIQADGGRLSYATLRRVARRIAA